MPHLFRLHLNKHNHRQMDTMWCLHRLCLQSTPCGHCGTERHSVTDHCPALLNLAIFLTNGRRSRQRLRYLGQFADHVPDEGPRILQRQNRDNTTIQETETQRAQQEITSYFRSAQTERADPVHGQTSPSARRLAPCPSSGTRICAAHQPGRGVDFAPAPHAESAVAAAEASAGSSPHTGYNADGDCDRAPGQAATGSSNNSAVPGLRPVPHSERGPQNALPLLVPQSTEADAKQGHEPGNQGGSTHAGWHPTDSERGPRSHSEIPLHDQDAQCRPGQSPAISLDGTQPKQWRNLASPAQLVLSQHLATCETDHATSDTAEERTGQAGAKASLEEGGLVMVRILLNRTGTVCFVNALLNALTWLTLLCGGLVPACWKHGFALMRCLTEGTHIPVDILACDPFRWIINGDWEMKDLLTQQDTIDFGHFFSCFAPVHHFSLVAG